MIYHLLYISQKTNHFSGQTDINQIIEASVRNNKRVAVTGILILNGKYFIQLLEGKRDVVVSTYQKISLDRRHDNIRTLMSFSDNQPIFPQWSMGLVKGEHHLPEMQELIRLIHDDVIKLSGSQEKVVQILKNFNQK